MLGQRVWFIAKNKTTGVQPSLGLWTEVRVKGIIIDEGTNVFSIIVDGIEGEGALADHAQCVYMQKERIIKFEATTKEELLTHSDCRVRALV